MKKILLFNPKSCGYNYRIPNSILSIAASIDGRYEYVMVDGNLEPDPLKKIRSYFDTGEFGYFGCTVMPGPQLTQAINFSKDIKQQYPNITTIWGGYFATNQHKVVLESGYIDFVINGPGDIAFPALIDALENNHPYDHINSLIFKRGNKDLKSVV